MRKIIAVATLGLVFGIAGAAGPSDESLEGRAYVGLSFGGQKAAPRDLHYGLRFDHDSRYAADRPVLDHSKDLPALMQFEFTGQGLSTAKVNGLSVLKPSYRLHQNEGAPAEQPAPAEQAPPAGDAAAPAEEEGFFSRTWHKITGMFGGGDEQQAAATEEKKPEEAAPEADVAQGTFMGYNAIDWATLAVGAVGLGFIASEVSNGDESGDNYVGTGGNGGGGSTTGGTTGGITGIIPCGGAAQPPCIPLVGGPGYGLFGTDEKDPEYQKWLDGGTGQMGDLGG